MIHPTAAQSSARRDGSALRGFEKRLSLPAAHRRRACERRDTLARPRSKALRPSSTWAFRRSPRRAEGTRPKRVAMSAPVSNVRPSRTRSSSTSPTTSASTKKGARKPTTTARCADGHARCGLEGSSIPRAPSCSVRSYLATIVQKRRARSRTRFELDPVQAAFNIGR